MESRYFKRDISWLSFSYRVPLGAEDDTLSLYERTDFISIYLSNLKEFYEICVAGHKAIATGTAHSDEENVQPAIQLVTETNEEVNRQLEEHVRIHEQKILPALRQHHTIFYQSRNVEPFYKESPRRFFREEISPHLSSALVSKDEVISFLRDNRLYLAVRPHSKGTLPGDLDRTQHFVMKPSYGKVLRFIELPKQNKNHHPMFIEDIIKASIDTIFPGYDVDSNYCIKISRDADILIDESANTSEIIEQVETRVKKRKIGAICRLVHDRAMSDDLLDFLADTFRINRQELVPGDKHLNMEDLRHLPNPNNAIRPICKPQPTKLACLDECESIFRHVEKKGLLLHYPYHSFEHFVHLLYETVHEPIVREIMVTQYRVAENFAVINTLIAAAQNGKKVTVFVGLKTRFDEENNLATAEMIKTAGISILFSLPGLKAHAKVALVLRHDKQGRKLLSYAYIGTGSFNKKTATLYADCGLSTCNPVLVSDLHSLFRTFQGEENPVLHRLLVARFNLTPELNRLISHEIEPARSGKQGRIVLKMNALQDLVVIGRLYEASQAGVKIDLIVRGICCLIPGRKYSRDIYVTHIVDTFLEHACVWYFDNGGKPKLFLGSPNWMRHSPYRRIEAIIPILDPDPRRELSDMLSIQLLDKRRACFVDDHLCNCWKSVRSQKEKIRPQYTFYEYPKG